MKPVLPLLLLCGLLSSCKKMEAYQRGCESFYRVPDIAALTGALKAAKGKWAAANLQNYSYTMRYGFSGMVSGTQTVSVRGGQVASSSGTGRTMEQLFGDVESKIAEAAKPNACVMLEASYDAADGHVLSSGFQNVQQGLQDAFGGYSITAFHRE